MLARWRQLCGLVAAVLLVLGVAHAPTAVAASVGQSAETELHQDLFGEQPVEVRAPRPLLPDPVAPTAPSPGTELELELELELETRAATLAGDDGGADPPAFAWPPARAPGARRLSPQDAMGAGPAPGALAAPAAAAHPTEYRPRGPPRQ